MDPTAVTALSQVITGPVSTWNDLRAAELAIRAFVFHDEPVVIAPYFMGQIITPGAEPFRVTMNEESTTQGIRELVASSGFHSILVSSEPQLLVFNDQNTEAAYLEQFARTPQKIPPPGTDLYFDAAAGDLARVADSTGDYFASYLPNNEKLASQYLSSIAPTGSPMYFAANWAAQTLERYPGNSGGSFFKSLDLEWNQAAEAFARTGLDVRLPPLLLIVMSRAPSRDAIVSEIIALRDEFASARSELWGLFDEVSRIPDFTTAANYLSRIHKDVAAIIPTALQANSGRNVFRFLFNWGRAAASWASGSAKLPGDYVLPRISIVDAARILQKELAETENIMPCLMKHFDDQELEALGVSKRQIDVLSGTVF